MRSKVINSFMGFQWLSFLSKPFIPVVGATWRGKDVMRSLPRKSRKPAMQTQKLQREKFTMLTAFLAPINPIVKRFLVSTSESKPDPNRQFPI